MIAWLLSITAPDQLYYCPRESKPSDLCRDCQVKTGGALWYETGKRECTLVHEGLGAVRQAGQTHSLSTLEHLHVSQSGDHMEALVYHCSWSTSLLIRKALVSHINVMPPTAWQKAWDTSPATSNYIRKKN